MIVCDSGIGLTPDLHSDTRQSRAVTAHAAEATYGFIGRQIYNGVSLRSRKYAAPVLVNASQLCWRSGVRFAASQVAQPSALSPPDGRSLC